MAAHCHARPWSASADGHRERRRKSARPPYRACRSKENHPRAGAPMHFLRICSSQFRDQQGLEISFDME
jgi:hypothetical protein